MKVSPTMYLAASIWISFSNNCDTQVNFFRTSATVKNGLGVFVNSTAAPSSAPPKLALRFLHQLNIIRSQCWACCWSSVQPAGGSTTIKDADAVLVNCRALIVSLTRSPAERHDQRSLLTSVLRRKNCFVKFKSGRLGCSSQSSLWLQRLRRRQGNDKTFLFYPETLPTLRRKEKTTASFLCTVKTAGPTLTPTTAASMLPAKTTIFLMTQSRLQHPCWHC